tara:strand:+ start:2328 stop:3326 length:999 start_codon:yes stop_codon:yes gene_type:complete
MLKNKSILVTGGTGSFGKELIKRILKNYPKIKRLVIYSRDELKQFEMSSEFNEKKYPGIRYFLGDVRDAERLNTALRNIDIVVHAAALKQIEAAEYNPFEFVKTNIIGSQNIVNASLNNNVSNVIALSSDKAVSPANLYGATKLCADKLFISANNIKGSKQIKFSIVRYGNVFASRGSVVPLFLKQQKEGRFTITDKRMTRFNMNLTDCVEMVLWCIQNNTGSEIFVPKLKSYKITDLAKAIDPKCKIKYIGSKPGEKIHESLMDSNENNLLVDLGKYYALVDSKKSFNKLLKKHKKLKHIKNAFEYNSGSNGTFMSVKQIKKLVSDFKKNN